MAQPVRLLRGFFSAFFAVNQPVWSGFLAGWPGLPNNEEHAVWNKRLGFALSLFFQMPTEVKLTMILFAIKHTLEFGPNTLLRSLAPDFLFGGSGDEPLWQPPTRVLGDDVAKSEARSMIRGFEESKVAGLTGWEDDEFGALESVTATNVPANTDVIKSESKEEALEFPAPFN